jgi:hypothetical protein
MREGAEERGGRRGEEVRREEGERRERGGRRRGMAQGSFRLGKGLGILKGVK